MRFQLRDLATAYQWVVVDEVGHVALESPRLPSRDAAVAAIERAVDALRDPRRYRSERDGGLVLADADGEELARARVPAGMTVGEFVAERQGDASDRERFRVEEIIGEGAPALSAGDSRDGLSGAYDYSVIAFGSGPGLHYSRGGAPYRFLLRDAHRRGIVFSRDYPDEASVRSAARALIRCGAERHVDRWSEGERHYFRVVDGRGRERGRSPGFAAESERASAIESFLRVTAAAPPASASAPTATDAPAAAASGAPGFEELRPGDGGPVYLVYRVEGGTAPLLSRAYRESRALQDGRRDIIRFGARLAQYRVRETDGRFVVVLLDGGGADLARARDFPSRSEAARARDRLHADLSERARGAGLAEEVGGDVPASTPGFEFEIARPRVAPPSPNPPRTMAHDPNPARREDNYLVCSAYEARVTDSRHPRHGDVITFAHDNGLHYFATLTEAGEVSLRSEGYPTAGARETGLKSVLRFREKRTRYKSEEVRGMHFTLLTAQNGQEIARSCPKGSAADAQALWPAVSAASAALAARAAEEAAAKTPEPATVRAEAHDPNPARREDNYLVCSAYSERATDSKHPRHDDVITFQHDNGLYYFATLTEDGAVALRSEGYPTTSARDTGLKSVLRFREKRARFRTEQKRNLYYAVLTAQNGQEIARSCPQATEAAAGAFFPAVGAAAAALAARAAAAAEPSAPAPQPKAASTPPPAAKAPADREDDYLACKEYRGRGITDPANRASLFRHENGRYYFALLGEDNGVRLRSGGFPDAAARDRELRSALKHVGEESRYERITRGDYYINVLRDDTGREVGRSCARKEVVPFVPVPMTAVAAGGLAAAAATRASVPAATPTSAPPRKATIVEDPVAAAPPPTESGGCAWWMWALAALLLLGLLFFLLRGCDADGPAADQAAVGAAAVEDQVDEAAEASAAAAAAAAAATAAAAAAAAVEEAQPVVEEVATLPPPRRPTTGGGLECGSIAIDAEYNDRGVPELPVDVFDGLAGEVQVFLGSGDDATQGFGLGDIEFLDRRNDLAIEPCSVGDVDRLAAVLRDHPDAAITISASDPTNCQTLAKLLRYRGVDRNRIDIRASPANELLVTQ